MRTSLNRFATIWLAAAHASCVPNPLPNLLMKCALQVYVLGTW